MRILCTCALFITVLTAAASMLDPLYDFDYARAGVKGFYITGGPDINMDNALYDKDGKKFEPDDFKYSSMDIWVPIRLGYSFNERYSFGVVVPIAFLSHKTTQATGVTEVTEANTALGNPWTWVKAVYMASNGFMIGPRLGVKLPTLAYTMGDQQKDVMSDPTADVKAITGDKSLAIDVAAVFAARPESNPFRLDGQLALRYSMEGTYKYDFTTFLGTSSTEIKDTPAMTLDFRAMPGMAFGDDKNFEAYLWLEYAMMMTEGKTKTNVDGFTVSNYTTKGVNMFTAGVKADYAFDPNNNLELKFLYDVMATGPTITASGVDTTGFTPAGISVGLGYFGFIPR